MSKQDYEYIGQIMDRFELITSHRVNRLSLAMDLEYSKVNLQALSGADAATFLHDVAGIRQHMDREACALTGSFVPRVGFRE